MYKKVSILVVVFVASAVFWFFAKPWIVDPSWSLGNFHAWLIPLLMLLLLISVVALAYMLLPEFSYRLGASLLIVVPFLVVMGFTAMNLSSAAIMVVLHLIAMGRIVDEIKARVTVHPSAIVSRGLTYIILPLLLMISFAYYQTPDVQAAAKNNKLPTAVEKAVTETTRRFLGSQLDELPPEQQAQAEEEINNQAIGQLEAWVKPYLKYAPPVLAIGLFLVLQGLSFAFFWLSSWLALLIFGILKTTGFVVIEEKDIRAQVLHL